jgi:hypothetical protein
MEHSAMSISTIRLGVQVLNASKLAAPPFHIGTTRTKHLSDKRAQAVSRKKPPVDGVDITQWNPIHDIRTLPPTPTSVPIFFNTVQAQFRKEFTNKRPGAWIEWGPITLFGHNFTVQKIRSSGTPALGVKRQWGGPGFTGFWNGGHIDQAFSLEAGGPQVENAIEILRRAAIQARK